MQAERKAGSAALGLDGCASWAAGRVTSRTRGERQTLCLSLQQRALVFVGEQGARAVRVGPGREKDKVCKKGRQTEEK